LVPSATEVFTRIGCPLPVGFTYRGPAEIEKRLNPSPSLRLKYGESAKVSVGRAHKPVVIRHANDFFIILGLHVLKFVRIFLALTITFFYAEFV
jgi:hypothetical protein